MVDGSFQPAIFGGPEGAVVKVELSDDSLGFGRAIGGIAREARKGPEGLLDRADRFYQMKEAVLPVHTAKRDAKALRIRANAVKAAVETLGDLSPTALASIQMLVADYARRFHNIDATITRSLPMIHPKATPGDIDDDWLGFVFEHIGGVGDDMVQELWARLLAQEASQPGRVSKRAVTKLSLMDRRSTFQLRRVLDSAITLYRQTPDPKTSSSGMPLYKIGRFVFPLLIEMCEWQGPKPSDDLVRGLHHSHASPGEAQRAKMRWLHEEGFLRSVSQDQLRNGYLSPAHWQPEWKSHERPLGLRVGLGPIYGCDARTLIDMIRRYANDGATAQIAQLTGLAEALLDPRIGSMTPTRAPVVGEIDVRAEIEAFLIEELALEPVPEHHAIAENPGFLGRDSTDDQYDLAFYYHEF